MSMPPGARRRTSASPDERLADLGLLLQPTPPRGTYVPAVCVGDLLFVSGHGPLRDGRPELIGRVPSQVSEPEARAAARLTAAQCLGTIRAELGTLDRVDRVVKLLGMVNADAGFERHPQVMDGASELLLEVFGERGAHARSAVGVASLPFGIPVEIEMIVQVRTAS